MTTRISKACHECRVRKIRCDGQQPCRHCIARGTACAYRMKARRRLRKSGASPGDGESSTAEKTEYGASTLPPDSAGYDRDINFHSVAATHRVSPSYSIQLHYGPSSVFALMNSIYHEIEGTPATTPSRQSVEEFGPGLDLFSHRRLFFGDFAGSQPSTQNSHEGSVVFLDMNSAHSFLERYLATYWHTFPTISKEEYRQRLTVMFDPPVVFSIDSPENVILAMAISIGASLMGDDPVCLFMLERCKQACNRLDEVVNLQMAQAYFMMAQLQFERARPNSGYLYLGSAIRRAAASGLYKEAREGEDKRESEQRIITFWALFAYENWTCLALGRPCSIHDPGGSGDSIPKVHQPMRSMVRLSRIVRKCLDRIYGSRHDSILPVWTAASEIRSDLLRFSKEETGYLSFQLTGPVQPGEAGVTQAVISASYHHVLQLTFRPFLILRAKLRKKNRETSSESSNSPPWLNRACEYCLSAAKDLITFLVGVCRDNVLCRELKYFNFFVEAACFTLAFDLMQETDGSRRNLPWIRSCIQCLRLIMPSKDSDSTQTPTTIAAFERMVRTVIPDFSTEVTDETAGKYISPQWFLNNDPLETGSHGNVAPVTANSSYTPQSHGSGGTGGQQMPEMTDGQLGDFHVPDMGLDFDFGTMDMDAFLSIDTTQDWGFRSY